MLLSNVMFCLTTGLHAFSNYSLLPILSRAFCFASLVRFIKILFRNVNRVTFILWLMAHIAMWCWCTILLLSKEVLVYAHRGNAVAFQKDFCYRKALFRWHMVSKKHAPASTKVLSSSVNVKSFSLNGIN